MCDKKDFCAIHEHALTGFSQYVFKAKFPNIALGNVVEAKHEPIREDFWL
jgi:hypothetical protein